MYKYVQILVCMGFLEDVLRTGITRDLRGILRIMKAMYVNYKMLKKTKSTMF